jgi:2-oxoglutarate dehydrogenase E1 component
MSRLSEVEGFEHFIHKTYVGQKRFSIEGLDMLVPLLDEIIDQAVESGTPNVNIGMAHRGRLNVLAHILRKPYEVVFSEFQHAPNKELVPSEGSTGINYGWSGDVKYHLGADRKIKKENTVIAHLTLANNPSHLEFVDPIVMGYTRAGQDDRNKAGFPVQNVNANMAILIHGDAAFIGEGIVTETLNLANLNGYHIGGIVHIIANNRIGFTTSSQDSRSTKYASDLAKGFEMPIIRVNADDPEAVLSAAQLAFTYRKQFHKDILIDLVGYRRYGHNEMDEPAATQPLMYEKIRKHQTVREIYAEQMKQAGIITEQEEQNFKKQVEVKLRAANDKVSEAKSKESNEPVVIQHNQLITKRMTGVSKDILAKMNEELIKWPDGFNVFPKLIRIYTRRAEAFKNENNVDWSLAEALAFATILRDGTPIRISGQDTERGTFAHRHLVLHDAKTGEQYSPLHCLSESNSAFAIHNSPLSEGSVLGFEYGYDNHAKDTLVIWEAQFGDFANAAQVIIDQFVAAGQAKWGQQSGLVMLLPHSYEGQGPEHSSGRIERFLQLSAENNWIVANVTSAAQYFHLLRRQASLLGTSEIRPLVLMTPKSLLRSPFTISNVDDLTQGSFESIVAHSGLGQNEKKVERLVLCSGKIAADLAQGLHDEKTDEWLHILHVEEIYPFPKEELFKYLNQYNNAKEIVWVQEEPMNMGAWNFVESRLRELAGKNIKVRYIGRKRRSSPAEGDPTIHKKEQERIIFEALTKD